MKFSYNGFEVTTNTIKDKWYASVFNGKTTLIVHGPSEQYVIENIKHHIDVSNLYKSKLQDARLVSVWSDTELRIYYNEEFQYAAVWLYEDGQSKYLASFDGNTKWEAIDKAETYCHEYIKRCNDVAKK